MALIKIKMEDAGKGDVWVYFQDEDTEEVSRYKMWGGIYGLKYEGEDLGGSSANANWADDLYKETFTETERLENFGPRGERPGWR